MPEKKEFDHRAIAKNLELYLSSEKTGQGLPLLLPNYAIIHHQIESFLRKKQKEFGFQEVITPILGSEELYQTSGHLAHYENYMFPTLSRQSENLRLRPMTCPHHCLIYQSKIRSYRDLPLRLCENSLLFRYEASGGLKGLERSRCFQIPDHHIFVSLKQLKSELKTNYLYIQQILDSLDLKISRLTFSTHDATNSNKYQNQPKFWIQAETVLGEVLKELKLSYVTSVGESAFYGPKLDLEIQTNDGKMVTLATMQVDFATPEKFALEYNDSEQKRQVPVLIHQSPIGSYQRFIALLCEQTQGWIPAWLAPYQLAILPLNEKSKIQKYCQSLGKKLTNCNLRVKTLESKTTLNYRLRQVYQQKIPYYLVIGSQEVASQELKLVSTSSKDQIFSLTGQRLVKQLKKIILSGNPKTTQ